MDSEYISCYWSANCIRVFSYMYVGGATHNYDREDEAGDADGEQEEWEGE